VCLRTRSVRGQASAAALTRGVGCPQALLSERGVKCDGCAEKKDLIARVEETYDMPVVTAQPVRLVRRSGSSPEVAQTCPPPSLFAGGIGTQRGGAQWQSKDQGRRSGDAEGLQGPQWVSRVACRHCQRPSPTERLSPPASRTGKGSRCSTRATWRSCANRWRPRAAGRSCEGAHSIDAAQRMRTAAVFMSTQRVSRRLQPVAEP
jgi:hypothetical protein